MDFLSIGKWVCLFLFLLALGAAVLLGVSSLINVMVDQPAMMLTDAVESSHAYGDVPGGGVNGLDWASLASAPMRGIDGNYVRPIAFVAAFVSTLIGVMIAGFVFHWAREIVSAG